MEGAPVRKAAVILTLAGLVAVGCGGGGTTASPTAEVLGVQITEGGEMRTVTGTPSPTPTPGPSPAASPSESDPAPRRVQDATVGGHLNWGDAEGTNDCVAIIDPEFLDADDYVLTAGVRPFVEGDCPNWEPRYDLGCIATIVSAVRRATVMQGELRFQLLVDGDVAGSWTVDVDEMVEAGDRLEFSSPGKAEVSSEGHPDVSCRVRFRAA